MAESMGPDFEEEQKPGFIKGIVQIPCMRKSWLYGISSGLVTGLSYFLFTSNVRKATKYGILGMTTVLMGTWIPCRYKFYQSLIQQHEQRRQQALSANGKEFEYIDPKDI